jgi:hypothetical protein
MLRLKWLVNVRVQDITEEWWERQYEADATDLSGALEAGRDKAWAANPYARDVRPYSAKVLVRSG